MIPPIASALGPFVLECREPGIEPRLDGRGVVADVQVHLGRSENRHLCPIGRRVSNADIVEPAPPNDIDEDLERNVLEDGGA